MWMTLIFAGTAALFLSGTLVVLWHLRWMHRLPPEEAFSGDISSGQAKTIRCSIVIAARNEEARIEQTVRRLLAQRDLEIELIVANDRSTDRTGELLEQLAA